MKDTYKVDPEKAFKSVIDCDGGKLDLKKQPSFDTSMYPECILPMDVRTK